MKVPESEDAVVNVARSLGSNGRGKGGVGGHMFAMASRHPKRFAPLLEMALQLKKSARPNEGCEWRGGEAMLSHEQALAQCQERGLPETLLDYLPGISDDELSPLDDGPPSSATDFLDAIIAAARSHGSNGRGKDGVEGYIRKLARIGCKTFDRLVIRAMVEQVKDMSRAHDLSPEAIEKSIARFQARGVDPYTVLQKAEAAYDPAWCNNVLDPGEIEDPWNMGGSSGSGEAGRAGPSPPRRSSGGGVGRDDLLFIATLAAREVSGRSGSMTPWRPDVRSGRGWPTLRG
jgi:hypothetical protein